MKSSVPVLTLLTDYGLRDEFVGVCHGVILRACPAARIIDVTHGIPDHDVRAGAITLARALPYLPPAVHLADVDAGRGAPRRDVAVACGDGRRLVGPDNGLLWPAVQAAGGAAALVDVSDSARALRPIAPTFRGRDVLAPVAAALAGGVALDAVGVAGDPASLRALPLPAPELRGGVLYAPVLAVDRFGNLELAAAPAHLSALGLFVGARLAVSAGASPPREVRFARTFADVEPGELVLYADPAGALALAVDRGSAAARLGLGADDVVRLSSP